MRKLIHALVSITGAFDLAPVPQPIPVRIATRERQIQNMVRRPR